MDIIFKEAEHSYFRGDIRYSGITSLLGKYKPKKDWDKIAENYSKKGVDHVLKGLSKNWQIPLKQAKEMWEEEFLQATNPKDWVRMMWKKKSNIALEAGSFFHNYMEILESKTANYNPIVNGEKHSLDLSILTPGTYLELMCFSHLHHICGQADKMILYEDNSFSLRDWKTSKTIDIEPKTFYSKGSKRRVAEHYLSPISHLTTNNYITYCLQLSCYAYMLELYGYKCKDLWIDHVIWEYEKPSYKLKKEELVIGEEPEFNRIKVYKRTDSIRANYLKPEVKALFNQHKNS